MDRPDSSMSYNGGVSLRGHSRRPSSPDTPTAMALLPYDLLAEAEGTPSRGLVSQERQERDAARALSAMQRRARGDDRDSLYRTPAELTSFIVSGAAVPAETSQEFSRRIRRNTNAASSDITPLYYEPPRRITYNSRDMILAPTPGRYQRTIACASQPANAFGNSIAFVNVEVQDPQIFMQLSPGSLPTVEQVFADLPFFEPCRAAAPSNAGVLRINNIPYTSPRSEVGAFVGRNVQILAQPAGSPYYAVHVIMERHTGKTMDAFIEFSKTSDAVSVYNEFKKRISLGRHPKLGDREVAVSISSQEDLMGELFPRARNVFFVGGAPHILDVDEFYYHSVKAAGFAGFLQNEEIIHMVKHAETPNRSPFAQRSFMRTYESMISTIHKYPWFAHEFVLMDQRRAIFEAAYACTRALVAFLTRTRHERIADQTKPTPALLQELVVAILTCPGFSEKQKHKVVVLLNHYHFGHMASGRHGNIKLGGNSAIAGHWPFEVLARNPKYSDQYVEWVAKLIKRAIMLNNRPRGVHPRARASLAEIVQERAAANDRTPFGNNVEIDYGGATTMQQYGAIEMQFVERLLRTVLPSYMPRTPQQMRANTNTVPSLGMPVLLARNVNR